MKNPLRLYQEPLSDSTLDCLWRLFAAICKYWKTAEDPTVYKTRFFSFVFNRMDFNPLYAEYYRAAERVINSLIEQYGEEQAFVWLLTDTQSNVTPPITEIAVVRQLVSNEFVALHLSLGAFKSFGATNYCGYFGGANLPGQPPPYRPLELK